MRARRLVATLALLLFSSGCAHRFSLALENGKPVEVTTLGSGTLHTFQPGTEGYQQFADWLARNRSGWNRYLATPPAHGRMVNLTGRCRLQFIDTSVILHTPEGVWIKDVSASEVAFLTR